MHATLVLALLLARPAAAGFRCGPGGEPSKVGPVSCQCPAGKRSTRIGSDWTCTAAVTPLAAPTLLSPGPDAQEVADATPFRVAAPAGARTIELELCGDRSCHAPLQRQTAAVQRGAVVVQWTQLPAAQKLYWRARAARASTASGPYSAVSSLTTSRPAPEAPIAESLEAPPAEAPKPVALEAPPAEAPKPAALEALPAEAPKPAALEAWRRGVPARHAALPARAASGWRTLAYGTGAVGLASLATGFAFAWHGHALSAEASRDGATYGASDASGRWANRIAIAGLVGGPALVIGSVVLYTLGARGGEGTPRSRVTIRPAVSSQAIGIVLGGSL